MDMEMFGIWILAVKPAWMCQIKAQYNAFFIE